MDKETVDTVTSYIRNAVMIIVGLVFLVVSFYVGVITWDLLKELNYFLGILGVVLFVILVYLGGNLVFRSLKRLGTL